MGNCYNCYSKIEKNILNFSGASKNTAVRNAEILFCAKNTAPKWFKGPRCTQNL